MAPLSDKSLVATWSAKGHVNIWDMTSHMTSLNLPGMSATQQSVKGLKEEPLFSFNGHQVKMYFMRRLHTSYIMSLHTFMKCNLYTFVNDTFQI